MPATDRPRGATTCPECRGTGDELVTDDVTDAAGEVIGEAASVYGACEMCEGRGWHPRETAAQRRDREAAEQAAHRARTIREAAEHQADPQRCARLVGGICHAPHRYHRTDW